MTIKALLTTPFMRFAISGGVAAAVNIGSRILISNYLNYSVSIVIAYLIGMTTAYMLMKLFVFENSNRTITQEYVRFSLVNIVALIQVWLVSVILVDFIFPSIEFKIYAETVAHIVGVLSPIATSYLLHKHFTFSRNLAGEK